LHKRLIPPRRDAVLTSDAGRIGALPATRRVGLRPTIRSVLALPVTQRPLGAAQVRRQLPGCARP
jgi:hypothetical protein